MNRTKTAFPPQHSEDSAWYRKLGDPVLEAYRQEGDPAADRLVEALIESGRQAELYRSLGRGFRPGPGTPDRPNPLDDFLRQEMLPAWADRERMAEGAAFFRAHCNEMLFLLGILSLPYCYAAARGARALWLSDKIRSNTGLRLADTALFLMDVMEEDAFHAGGPGFTAINQVRLRHALARHYIRRHPAFQDLAEVPVNQEDMAGTNLAFSYIVLGGLRRLGMRTGLQNRESFLHLWSVIGRLMGLREELLPYNLRAACWLERRIRERQFGVSAEGRALMASLLEHFQAVIPNRMTRLLLPQLCRHLLGKELTAILGLPEPAVRLGALDPMGLLPLFRPFIFPPSMPFAEVKTQIEQERAGLAAALPERRRAG